MMLQEPVGHRVLMSDQMGWMIRQVTMSHGVFLLTACSGRTSLKA
jgi:hypothetical protein